MTLGNSRQHAASFDLLHFIMEALFNREMTRKIAKFGTAKNQEPKTSACSPVF
jgi:hypothetical protein